MTIDKFKIFRMVYETESIKETADKLLLDPSMISRTLKQLETEYQITLFIRVHRGIQRTPQADAFYQNIIQILELDRISHNICSVYETVRIGCTTTIGTYLLPPVLSRIKKLLHFFSNCKLTHRNKLLSF